MKILVKRIDKQAAPVSGKLSLRTRPSQNSYLTVETTDGMHLEIGGRSEELVTLLQGLAGQDKPQPVDPDTIPQAEWSPGRKFIYDRLKRVLPDLMD